MLQNVSSIFLKKEYVQNIPGRARIRVDALLNKPRLCMHLTDYFSLVEGILMFSANSYTSKILVIYDISKINLKSIDIEINNFFRSKIKKKTVGKKAGKSKFLQHKVLSLQEFRDSKNVLSKEYLDYNIIEINKNAGLKPEISWHTLSPEETEVILKTDIANGLKYEAVEDRLKKFGFNQIEAKNKQSLFSLLLNQFDGFIIKLLLAASGISLLLGQTLDALTILVIIFTEALLGVLQQRSTQKSLESLSKMSAPTAKVIRNSKKIEISASHIVPGEVICLEAGDIVPADARIIESHGLEVIEASMTGEAFPVFKKNVTMEILNTPLADRLNMLYMGTYVVKGSAKAIAVSCGKNTEMGKIAGMLNDVKTEKSPLQKDLNHIAELITWSCLGICAVITIGGLLGGHSVAEMLATGLSLAVGAIPEGLSTVLAISLAFGAQRLSKKNAIVKSLPSMETLSCTKVICTDKTGTLTKNEMTVKAIYTLNNQLKVMGEGYNTRGRLLTEGKRFDFSGAEDIKQLLASMALCNNAEIIHIGNRNFNIKGDPTEAALLIAVEKAGIKLDDYKCFKREHEIPFDPETKKMTAICTSDNENYFAYTKGAIDIVLKKCTKIFSGNLVDEINEEHKKKITLANEKMADGALRVLALSYKPLLSKPKSSDDPEVENEMTFLGLVGILDPPRPEVKAAIKKCNTAGIKVVMITGDHKNTAAAIAKSIGILNDRGVVLTGTEIENMNDIELTNVIDKVQVFARTSPLQKLKIVKAFKRKGHIVAMTGDGINDAPSLKEAHIGIAMGKTGTEVTKEASSIILTDDNFNTIVKAVEEGRTVNRNIKKFMKYVLSGNFAEVLAIFLSSVSGLPTPLIPAQILMLNLVTEGIPALALGVDPPEKDIMNEPPRDHNISIFDNATINSTLSKGVAIGLSTLGVFGFTLYFSGSLIKARTMCFVNLVASQMIHALQCSSMGIRRNKFLLPAIAVSSGITLSCMYIPSVASAFKMVPLLSLDWMLIAFSVLLSSKINKISEYCYNFFTTCR